MVQSGDCAYGVHCVTYRILDLLSHTPKTNVTLYVYPLFFNKKEIPEGRTECMKDGSNLKR